MNQVYLDTARLMIQVAVPAFANNVFALKGGTAINLFVRDMPRLFVDWPPLLVSGAVALQGTR